MIARSRDIPTRLDEAEARGQVSHPRTTRGTYRRVRIGACGALPLLLVLTSPVWAQGGINLSWDDCGTAGSSLKSFACDTNAGSSVLVASFAAPTDLTQLSDAFGVLDLQTSSATLPNWWRFKNPEVCRQTAFSASADFTSGPGGCPDPWKGGATSGVVSYQAGFGGSNRARILVATFLNIQCLEVAGEVEHAAFKLILSNVMSVGTDSCAGCMDGACIVLNSMYLGQCNGPNFDLTTPLDRNFVTWQAGIPNCPGATPVQNRTWGALKTLYR